MRRLNIGRYYFMAKSHLFQQINFYQLDLQPPYQVKAATRVIQPVVDFLLLLLMKSATLRSVYWYYLITNF